MNVGEVEVERAPRRARIEIEPERSGPLQRTGALRSVALLGAAALVGWAGSRVLRRLGGGRVAVGARLGRTAGNLGRGFLAGMAGTFAITAASTTDQLVTEALHARREKRKPDLDLAKAIVSPWSFSSDVVGKVVGIRPIDDAHGRRLSVMAHWDYGSTWGVSLAVMHALGVRRIPAMGALLAGQLGAEMVVMPALKLFGGPSTWGRRAIVSSVYQHAIYAIAAVSAFEWMRPVEV